LSPGECSFGRHRRAHSAINSLAVTGLRGDSAANNLRQQK
jgi:hypothetical protein